MYLRVRITKWPCSMTTSHFNTVPVVGAGADLESCGNAFMLYETASVQVTHLLDYESVSRLPKCRAFVAWSTETANNSACHRDLGINGLVHDAWSAERSMAFACQEPGPQRPRTQWPLPFVVHFRGILGLVYEREGEMQSTYAIDSPLAGVAAALVTRCLA